jgi:hypothetical protein
MIFRSLDAVGEFGSTSLRISSSIEEAKASLAVEVVIVSIIGYCSIRIKHVRCRIGLARAVNKKLKRKRKSRIKLIPCKSIEW